MPQARNINSSIGLIVNHAIIVFLSLHNCLYILFFNKKWCFNTETYFLLAVFSLQTVRRLFTKAHIFLRLENSELVVVIHCFRLDYISQEHITISTVIDYRLMISCSRELTSSVRCNFRCQCFI